MTTIIEISFTATSAVMTMTTSEYTYMRRSTVAQAVAWMNRQGLQWQWDVLEDGTLQAIAERDE